jgi:hypothetical protein
LPPQEGWPVFHLQVLALFGRKQKGVGIVPELFATYFDNAIHEPLYTMLLSHAEID